jgi:hypothetical protein
MTTSFLKKYENRLNNFQCLSYNSIPTKNSLELRKRLRVKKQEKHRIKYSSNIMHKYSHSYNEPFPDIPESIYASFQGLCPSTSTVDVFNTIKYKLETGCDVVLCVEFIHKVFLSSSPPYFTFMYSGIYKDLIKLASDSTSEYPINLILESLCNFAVGPNECVEAIVSAGGLSVCLKLLDKNSGPICTIIKTVGNLIDTYVGYYNFNQLNGFDIISNKLPTWTLEILKEVIFIFTNISDFIPELNSQDLKVFVGMVEELIGSGDAGIQKDCLYIMNSICTKSIQDYKFNKPYFISFAISYMIETDIESCLHALQIIGNSVCRGLIELDTEVCLYILDRVPYASLNTKIKEKSYWVLICLVSVYNSSKVFFTHEIYEKTLPGLYDAEIKIRKKAIRLYRILFTSLFYSENPVYVPVSLFDAIYEGLDSSYDKYLTIKYLKLLEDIIYIQRPDLNIKIALQSSHLLLKIEELVYHKNNQIMLSAGSLLEHFNISHCYDQELLKFSEVFKF